MLGFVEMALATEKHDPMAHEGIADRSHRCGRQFGRQPHTMDLRTAGVIGTCEEPDSVRWSNASLPVCREVTASLEGKGERRVSARASKRNMS